VECHDSSFPEYGIIWFQGESNAAQPNTYICTFPAMIDDWRAKWFEGSHKHTNEMLHLDLFRYGVTYAYNMNTYDKEYTLRIMVL